MRSDSWVCSRSHGQPSGSRSRAEIQGMPHGEAMSATGATGPRYSGSPRSAARQRADGRGVREPEPADGMVGGVEPADDRHGVRGVTPVPAGERPDHVSNRHARAHARGGHDQERDGRFDRRRDEALRDDDAEARRRVELPAEAGLREKRVQHRAARCPGVRTWWVRRSPGRGSRRSHPSASSTRSRTRSSRGPPAARRPARGSAHPTRGTGRGPRRRPRAAR